jgi:hypothetical protein
MKSPSDELKIQNKKVLPSENIPDNHHDDLDQDSGSRGVI